MSMFNKITAKEEKPRALSNIQYQYPMLPFKAGSYPPDVATVLCKYNNGMYKQVYFVDDLDGEKKDIEVQSYRRVKRNPFLCWPVEWCLLPRHVRSVFNVAS